MTACSLVQLVNASLSCRGDGLAREVPRHHRDGTKSRRVWRGSLSCTRASALLVATVVHQPRLFHRYICQSSSKILRGQ